MRARERYRQRSDVVEARRVGKGVACLRSLMLARGAKELLGLSRHAIEDLLHRRSIRAGLSGSSTWQLFHRHFSGEHVASPAARSELLSLMARECKSRGLAGATELERDTSSILWSLLERPPTTHKQRQKLAMRLPDKLFWAIEASMIPMERTRSFAALSAVADVNSLVAFGSADAVAALVLHVLAFPTRKSENARASEATRANEAARAIPAAIAVWTKVAGVSAVAPFVYERLRQMVQTALQGEGVDVQLLLVDFLPWVDSVPSDLPVVYVNRISRWGGERRTQVCTDQDNQWIAQHLSELAGKGSLPAHSRAATELGKYAEKLALHANARRWLQSMLGEKWKTAPTRRACRPLSQDEQPIHSL